MVLPTKPRRANTLPAKWTLAWLAFQWKSPSLGYWIAPMLLGASVPVLVFMHDDPDIVQCLGHIIVNITKEGTPLALLSIGTALVLSTGGVDISSAGVATIAGVIFAALTQAHVHPVLAAIPACAIGVGSGVALGITVSRAAPPLIMSWAVGSIWLTASVVLAEFLSTSGFAKGNTSNVESGVHLSDTFWTADGRGPWLCMLILLLITGLIALTNLPRRARAIGADADSAVYAGIRPRSVLTQTYALSAFLSALAGVLWVLVNNGGGTNDHAGKELIAVAIAVLGGTAMSGGYLALPSVAAASFFWVATLTILRGMDFTSLGSQQQRAPGAVFAVLLIIGSILFGSRLGGLTRTIHADYRTKGE